MVISFGLFSAIPKYHPEPIMNLTSSCLSGAKNTKKGVCTLAAMENKGRHAEPTLTVHIGLRISSWEAQAGLEKGFLASLRKL